jgi:cystathionine beta-lyase/cystathionine gamma-synthase
MDLGGENMAEEKKNRLQISTQIVHGGQDVPIMNGPKIQPIYQTSVFTFDDLDQLDAYYDTPKSGYMYTRFANPNHRALELNMAGLERGEDAVAAASGMAAIMASILTFAESGDHIVCANEIYGGTLNLLQKELSRLGIQCTFANFSDLQQIEEQIQNNTKILITETITNPLLHVIDILAVAELAHRHGAKLVVDNTFTTPLLIRPLKHGADLVIHSATKYIGGHSDVTSGVIIGNQPHIDRAREIIVGFGASLSPFEAWLTHRGLKTLALRFKKQCENAQVLAEALQTHPAIHQVYYPGLPAHPQHELATNILTDGYGAMLSFAIDNDKEKTNELMRGFQWVSFAPSLAGVETTISHPLRTSHRALTPKMQEELGIHYGLIRVSVGIEDPTDLVQEFIQALNQITND